MMDVSQVNGADIFNYTMPQSDQLEGLANRMLSNGMDLYTKKDFDGAIKAFQRAIGLSPSSLHSVDAANYMALSYLNLNNTQGAIDAYKRAVQLDPSRDDSHANLGNLYFSNKRYQEAQQEYEAAVKLNPSASNRFSLGQAYMYNGRYGDAEGQFTRVQELEPNKPNGYYGLGQNYAKQGLYDSAISALKKAIDVQQDFYDSYAELGYAYAASGEIDEANKILDLLKDQEPDLADSLGLYIVKQDPPKFSSVQMSSSSFQYYMSIGMQVAFLDPYLANANAAKTFTMAFQFDKDMDRESVENPLNWKISRTQGGGPGQAYNFGLPIPSTEVQIMPVPISVYYDADAKTATVQFNIQQNAFANGTIDPSHMEFTFTGKDRYGLAMDPLKNQFSGFSGIA